MNAVGRTVDVDGVFGPGTEAAVKDFQTDHQLPADGVVSPTVWQMLVAGIDKRG